MNNKLTFWYHDFVTKVVDFESVNSGELHTIRKYIDNDLVHN